MKKMFLSVAVVAMMVAFTSCKNDNQAPVITLPEDVDVPVFDLGDAAAALVGVTANDNVDGDVTENITVSGLEYVGAGEVVYSVLDQANNEGVATRAAKISSGKLGGAYKVSSVDLDDPDADPYTYNVTAAKSDMDPAKLIVTNFFGSGWNLTLVGNGKDYVLECDQPLRVTYGDGQVSINVTATYGPTSDGGYTLLVMTYTIIDAVTNEVIGSYEDTLELR